QHDLTGLDRSAVGDTLGDEDRVVGHDLEDRTYDGQPGDDARCAGDEVGHPLQVERHGGEAGHVDTFVEVLLERAMHPSLDLAGVEPGCCESACGDGREAHRTGTSSACSAPASSRRWTSRTHHFA